MKRILIILFAISFCILYSPFATATTSYASDVLFITTPDAFNSIFTTDSGLIPESTINLCSSESNAVDVSYTYQFEVSPSNPCKANVCLSFNLAVGQQVYLFSLKGTIGAYQLSWGDILWEGPIYGCQAINDVDYTVIASFARINDSQNAQISVSIQSKSGLDQFEPVCFPLVR